MGEAIQAAHLRRQSIPAVTVPHTLVFTLRLIVRMWPDLSSSICNVLKLNRAKAYRTDADS